MPHVALGRGRRWRYFWIARMCNKVYYLLTSANWQFVMRCTLMCPFHQILHVKKTLWCAILLCHLVRVTRLNPSSSLFTGSHPNPAFSSYQCSWWQGQDPADSQKRKKHCKLFQKVMITAIKIKKNNVYPDMDEKKKRKKTQNSLV